MDITNEQRDEAYKTASEIQRYLYAAPESGRRMSDIATKHGIVSTEQYRNYALLVGDVILNLRNRSELPAAMTETLGIKSEQSVKITADLIDFLDHKEKTNDSENLASDIAETEATLEAIPQVRTMADDMRQSQAAKETIYSSSQEAILKDGRTAAS